MAILRNLYFKDGEIFANSYERVVHGVEEIMLN